MFVLDPSYLVGGSTHCCTDNVCGHSLLLYFKLYIKLSTVEPRLSEHLCSRSHLDN